MESTPETLTIQQAARTTGLSEHTLRYYERIGLIHRVARARNSHRRYSADDLGWIDFLMKLRATGMPIRQMQEYAKLQRKGDLTLPRRIEILKQHRLRVERELQELTKHLQIICYKIEMYQQLINQTQPIIPSPSQGKEICQIL